MKPIMQRGLVGAFILTLFTLSAFGQNTGTTQLSMTVAPEASITINSPTTTLGTTAGTFGAPFTGSTGFSYKIRTNKAGGSGTVMVQITTDFSAGTTGPSVAAPPTAGDALTYTCTAAPSGSACSSAQTASHATATNVISFGNNAHSTLAGDAGSVAWSMTNDPLYETGTYTATATFTIATL
jgi:hypothetical protein